MACTSTQSQELEKISNLNLTTPITTFYGTNNRLRLEVTYNGIPAAPSVYNPSPVIGVGNNNNFKLQIDNNKPTTSSDYETKIHNFQEDKGNRHHHKFRIKNHKYSLALQVQQRKDFLLSYSYKS